MSDTKYEIIGARIYLRGGQIINTTMSVGKVLESIGHWRRDKYAPNTPYFVEFSTPEFPGNSMIHPEDISAVVPLFETFDSRQKRTASSSGRITGRF